MRMIDSPPPPDNQSYISPLEPTEDFFIWYVYLLCAKWKTSGDENKKSCMQENIILNLMSVC